MKDLLNNKTFHYIFLIYFSLLSTLSRVARWGLRPDADAWYAQKGKELLKSTNPFIVTYNGEPSFEHTPFVIWVDAISFKIFGVSSYGAIFPSAVFATLTIVITYKLSYKLFGDRWIAFIAGIILLFPGYFFENARRGHVDATLGFMVIMALYCFWRGNENSKWYYGYGLATGCAVLTKSLVGLFPYVIGLLYLIFTRQFRKIFQPHLVLGVTLGTICGFSWFIFSWIYFENAFYEHHLMHMLFRNFGEDTNQLAGYIFYLKEIFKYYWPWFPILVFSFWVFFEKVYRNKRSEYLFVLIWFFSIYIIMSLHGRQQMQYMISIFPAMALMVSKVIGDSLTPVWRLKSTPYIIGVIMFVTFFIGGTNIEIKNASSLNQKSEWTRNLAAVINLNTPIDGVVANYRIGNWQEEPRTGLLFFADRYLVDPIFDEKILIDKTEKNPKMTWLTHIEVYQKLLEDYPDRFYLIQANKRYAYFTSKLNRDNIQYDFSKEGLTYLSKELF